MVFRTKRRLQCLTEDKRFKLDFNTAFKTGSHEGHQPPWRRGNEGVPGDGMKVIVIRQPWAWLIVNGFKDIENRSWRTRYRGPLMIHPSGGRFLKRPDVSLYVLPKLLR
jgi:hypothetical protein